MNCTEALKILEPLAEGVNPTTGEVLPADSPFQQGQVVRALACAVELAKREIRKSELPQGAGKPWTQEQDAQLRREFHQELHFDEIAKIHQRTRGAIIARLVRLGELAPELARR